MIDWLRGMIEFKHCPIPSGKWLSIHPSGEIEKQGVKPLSVEGSYDSRLFIRSVGCAGEGLASHLQINGNPSKFLQGHNVIGSRDLISLTVQTFEKILSLYELHLVDQLENRRALKLLNQGNFEVKGIHINQLYDLKSDANVEAWLYAASQISRTSSRYGRATSCKGTVYLQQHSRRWAIKFYNKYRELLSSKKHNLPFELQDSGLLEFVEGMLRIELVLHSLELHDLGLTMASVLTPEKINSLFDNYVSRIDMRSQQLFTDESMLKMPRCVLGTFQLWRQGADVKSLMTESTFFRHRKILLDYGFDISLPPVAPELNNIIPLVRILEAVPVQNPSWAYEKGLIALLTKKGARK